MNTNQENNPIDEAFRKGIEQLELSPTSMNIDSIRADTLQIQLARSTIQVQWLRRITGILLLLLGGFGLKIYHQAHQPLNVIRQEKMVEVIKTDTIYRTIYIPVKEYKQGSQPEPALIYSSNKQGRIIPKKYNTTHSVNKYGKTTTFSDSIRLNNKNNLIAENELTTREGIPLSELAMHTPEQKTESGQLQRLDITNVHVLKPISTKLLNAKFSLPKLPNVSVLSSKVSEKTSQEPRIPLRERITFSGYYGIEKTNVTTLKDQVEAFSFENEVVSSTKNYGFRVGFKINQRWSIITGYDDINYSFENETDKKRTLKAEIYEGEPTFLHRSIFGVAKIPNNLLAKVPKEGDELEFEEEDDHLVGYVRIPLIFKYSFLDKNVMQGNRLYGGLSFYGLIGGVYGIPNHQELNIELYERSGRSFNTVLSNFKNNTNTFGITLGCGAEYQLTNKIGIFIEPTYNRLISTMVKDMPLRTYTGSFGVKFGINYQLINNMANQRKK